MTNENDSDRPTTDPHGQPPQQPPVPPLAPLQGALPDDSKRKAYDTKNEADELAREFRAAEKWVIGTNITLAIIGVIALCIYNGQLKVMRGQLGEIVKQYPEIKKSAEATVTASQAATYSLNAIKTQFQADQRPWALSSSFRMFNSDTRQLGPPVVGKPLMANAEFKNYGKTPALNVIIHAHIIFGESDILHKLKPEPPDVKTNGAIVPQGEVFSKTVVSVKDTFKYEDGFAVDTADLVNWDGTQPIVIFGRVTYEDSAGNHYCSPYAGDYSMQSNAWAHVSYVTAKDKKFAFVITNLCPNMKSY